jgi:hypothetical protein
MTYKLSAEQIYFCSHNLNYTVVCYVKIPIINN